MFIQFWITIAISIAMCFRILVEASGLTVSVARQMSQARERRPFHRRVDDVHLPVAMSASHIQRGSKCDLLGGVSDGSKEDTDPKPLRTCQFFMEK